MIVLSRQKLFPKNSLLIFSSFPCRHLLFSNLDRLNALYNLRGQPLMSRNLTRLIRVRLMRLLGFLSCHFKYSPKRYILIECLRQVEPIFFLKVYCERFKLECVSPARCWVQSSVDIHNFIVRIELQTLFATESETIHKDFQEISNILLWNIWEAPPPIPPST